MNDKLALMGLDGSNPLAFLAALGTLRVMTQARPDHEVKMAWAVQNGTWSPMLHVTEPVDETELIKILIEHLERDIHKHPAAFLECMHGAEPLVIARMFRDRASVAQSDNRNELDWLSAMASEIVPKATSQLQTARRDYFFGNMKNVMSLTTAEHLERTLFQLWDYGDPLENQSLHLEPSEDRRHAHQWHTPSGDPTRKTRGGMLGANRLAIEAFPIFQSIATSEKLSTRGFFGNRADNTRWTWPIWTCPANLDMTAGLLALESLQSEQPDAQRLQAQGIAVAYRSRRILVLKTPNFTPAQPV